MYGIKDLFSEKAATESPDARLSPKIRLGVQLFFLVITLFTAWRFIRFIRFLQEGGPAVSRPPGVEAFLPISSLMSLKYWILSGDFNTIHPAGLVLFMAFVLMALVLKRTFCSWVCPVGLLSEYLWKGGRGIFSKNLKLPRWLDYPLRSLKYLLLLFFAWGILVEMNVIDLRNFIYSPYNRVADIKMLLFFAHISAFSLGVIIVLALLSLVIKNFWCRYLCPYGALTGFVGLFSPVKITRNPDTCTDCRMCTEACPANIEVHKKIRVRSDECTACLTCTSVCPEPDTLSLNLYKQRKPVSARSVAVLVILIFLLFVGTARLTGHWQNKISADEYRYRLEHIDEPVYQHTGE
ncbi:MAG: 4Fe-4S binding protein [Chlorobi bacterium]|nr:4Fe-4S binding protein [Chlorobiota bacterium]